MKLVKLTDPVVLSNGKSYERSKVLEEIEKKGQNQLINKNFYENRMLKSYIEWLNKSN
jgi:hypothetical protein